MNEDRHILITGGAGYIGSLLTAELLQAGFRVTVMDRARTHSRDGWVWT